MTLLISHRGGPSGVRPHLENTVRLIPVYWKQCLPHHVVIHNVAKVQSPHKDNIWGSQSTVHRAWAMKMKNVGPTRTNIKVCAQGTIEGPELHLFQRDLVTAILLCAFQNKIVTQIISNTLHHWSPVRYNVGRILAEELASYMVNPKLAKEINPRLSPFVKELNREILEATVA